MTQQLGRAEARRIALAAQGFDAPDRNRRIGWAQIERAINRLHLLQIDSVNVLVRSHYLPLFSRLGAYDRATLDAHSLNNHKRKLFECWAHEASLLPLPLHPLARWRMNRALAGNGTYKSMDRFAKENASYLSQVLNFVQGNGPTTASELPDGGKSEGGWWGWSKGKMALECLFDQGRITTSARAGFERLYDIPERVIPAEILDLPTPNEAETFRTLLDMAGHALGIGTEFDLRDYFRLPGPETKIAIAELVEAGVLQPVNVEGWNHRAYLHTKARKPRKAGGSALLSPFDPLVWDRARAERLFEFHYRIEIYTPAPKRKFGYYVLPFLDNDRLSGRVCLKADRQSSTLLANAIHSEAHADKTETAEALAPELHRMAAWLGLNSVKAGAKGNLAAAVRKAL